MNMSEPVYADIDLLTRVKSDKLQLLYQQSAPAVFISLLNAVLLLGILWPVQQKTTLLIWFAALFCTAAARLFLFRRYHHANPQGSDVLVWETPYFVTLILSSIVWGFGSVFIMPTDSALHQVAVYSFLIGMSGGAISVYSAQREMTLATVAILLFPATGYFFISGNDVFIVMAIGASLLYFSIIRSTSVLSTAMHENFLMTHQLEISRKEAERLARVDELTGLYNRRAFYEQGNVLVNSSLRNTSELAVILMDVDNFKAINDQFGHAAGDDTLKQIGSIMRQRLRKSDVFARVGGEEFAMLLPQTSLQKATQLAEDLRQAIQAEPVIYENERITVTASFGVTSGISDIDSLVCQADSAMYQAKEAGRNSVHCEAGG